MSEAPIHVRIVVVDDISDPLEKLYRQLTGVAFRLRNRMRRYPATPREGNRYRKRHPRRRHGR